MIVNRHIGTDTPYNGLSPNVLNIPLQYQGYPRVAHTSGIASKTQRTQGSSIAAGTQIDYPRHVQVLLQPTQSSAGVSAGGGVTIWGRDYLDVTRSETFGTGMASNATGLTGSINFAKVDTISMLFSFHSDTSSAASAFSLYVGQGARIGLPVRINSSNAIYAVNLGTLQYSTYSHSDSTSTNQWTVYTGDYWHNGVSIAAVSSASQFEVGYLALGHRAPFSPII